MFSVAFIKIETLVLQNKKDCWLPISKQWITSGNPRRENEKANTGGEVGGDGKTGMNRTSKRSI